MVRDENSGRIHTVYISYAEYKNDESCRSFRKFVYMDPCVCVCIYVYMYIYVIQLYGVKVFRPLLRGKGETFYRS